MPQESDETKRIKSPGKTVFRSILNLIKLAVLLYLFLFAIGLLAAGFKSLGEKFAETLVHSTSNPVVGLLIGILVTSIIQSSSTTTSIIVGMVSSGVLTVGNAVPIVMGANVGTTVTSTLVSLGSSGQFQRALSAATMHDFFNIIAILIFLPIEIVFHPLEKGAILLTGVLTGFSGGEFHSPIKAVVKPPIHTLKDLLCSQLGLHFTLAGIIMLLISIALIFISLYFLVRLLRSLLADKIENTLDRFIGRRGIVGIFIGFIVTGIIQSSSVTTSMLVPLIAARIMSLESGFAIVLGANLGTTLTALMASLAGEKAGLSIALVHFLFNLCGILVIYPIPRVRRIPIYLARRLALLTSRSRIYAVLYVLCVFFILPFLVIIIDKLFR